MLEKSVFDCLKDCRKKFIVNALCLFAGIKGKINFLQMQRFCEKCEQYFRINFENRFNFQQFNLTVIKGIIGECVVAFDPSRQPAKGGLPKNSPDGSTQWNPT